MNKAILAGGMVLLIFLPVSAFAKQQPAKPLTAADIVAKMKIQLQLTDKQAEEVKPIIEDYLAQEAQIKLEEKNQLSKVLTGDQLFTWNFLQNEPPHEKKKHSSL